MLLEKLIELRSRQDVDDAIPRAYHKEHKLAWGLEISSRGEFVQWTALDMKEATPYRRRASDASPFLFVDKCEYLLGTYPVHLKDEDPATRAKQETKARKRLEDFRAQVQLFEASCPEHSVDSVRARALGMFLGDGAQRELASAKVSNDLKRGDLVVPIVDGVMLHRGRSVARFWASFLDQRAVDKSKIEAACMLCGEYKKLPVKHPIELKLGADRPQLISANERCFESYGLKRASTSGVCQSCARQYGEALRYLLDDSRSRYRVGDVHYVFWTKEPTGDSWGDYFSSPEPEQVQALIKSAFTGRGGEAAEANDFYAVAMTSNISRLVIRDWITTTVQHVRENLSNWFSRQELQSAYANKRIDPQGIFALAASTVHDVNKHLSPRTIPALVASALHGTPLPRDLLAQTLRRVAHDKQNTFTNPRIVLIRMAINDLIRAKPDFTEELLVPPALDPDDSRPGYLYGRLFATLAEIQYSALGNINTTIVDRFYGSASTAPKSVFPRLLRGAQAHLQKVRKKNPGAYHSQQRRLEELLGMVSDFDATLDLEQQGLFALGYYHERGATTARIALAMAQKETETLDPEK